MHRTTTSLGVQCRDDTFSPFCFYFLVYQGDTLENVAKELHCIIKTGYYIFCTPDASSNVTEIMLKYTPSASHQSCPTSSLQSSQPSSLEDVEAVPLHEQTFPDVVLQQESQNTHNTPVVNVQHWNSEQISDFVRKLGFLDTEKEGGHDIKHFLHVNEVCVCWVCDFCALGQSDSVLKM